MNRDEIRALMEGADLPTLDELLHRPAWHARAACAGQGTDAFYPERGGTGDLRWLLGARRVP